MCFSIMIMKIHQTSNVPSRFIASILSYNPANAWADMPLIE